MTQHQADQEITTEGLDTSASTTPLRCPTPTSSDWKGSSKPGQRRGQLTDPAIGVIPAGGHLNPEFVEWLMAFPSGWSDLAPLETHKFQLWRQQHGGF
jgi:hypothetical protein